MKRIVAILLLVGLLLASCDTYDGSLVYVTGSGTKFHRATCRYVDATSIEMARADAIAAGYTACLVCEP